MDLLQSVEILVCHAHVLKYWFLEKEIKWNWLIFCLDYSILYGWRFLFDYCLLFKDDIARNMVFHKDHSQALFINLEIKRNQSAYKSLKMFT